MKVLIHQVPEASGGVYQLWAELTAVDIPENCQQLTFSSVWTGAQDPEAPQIKGQFFLDQSSIANLRKLLG